MRPVQPTIDVPGDTGDAFAHPRIMARSGAVVGMDHDHAVWRFGFLDGSESANEFGASISERFPDDYGFLWVLATRRTAKVKDTFRGFAAELPPEFVRVIEWEPGR